MNFQSRVSCVPEWEQLNDDGKGRLVIGASTQRQMVKYLSPQDQLDMIEIAKEDKKKALAVWRSFKPELGIE